MIGKFKQSITIEDILSKVSEAEIASYYLHIDRIPTTIHSPFRKDINPSFGLNSPNGVKVRWVDYSTGETGGIFDIVMRLFNISFQDALEKVYRDLCNYKGSVKVNKSNVSITDNKHSLSAIEIEVEVREWEDYDIEYWNKYGINLDWLKYAEVYPIRTKVIIKNGKKFISGVDKYAYVYIERKEGRISKKIYQPYNRRFKWLTTTDSSVIGLWTKVPSEGDRIVICSSLKDALCLWSNTGIPALYIQGEGYKISDTAINELKRRYKQVYILFDNDKPGIEDAKKLSHSTGFKYIELPSFIGGKDVSDFCFVNGRMVLVNMLFKLLGISTYTEDDNVPF